jgi:hypothetical protein
MSIWSDIQDRSAVILRKEEFKNIYPGKLPDKNLLDSGDYKDGDYMIFTSGLYPYITVRISMELSVFAGAGIVKIHTKDGDDVELKRTTAKGGYSVYTLELNRDEDFVLDEHDGKQYSLDMLRELAKDLIDQILKCEYDLKNRF